MRILKINLLGEYSPSGLKYVGKDDALKKYIAETPPDNRLIYTTGDDKSSTIFWFQKETAIGYLCDVDYDANTATIALYYDDVNDLSGYYLAFSMIGTTTDDTAYIDKIIGMQIKPKA